MSISENEGVQELLDDLKIDDLEKYKIIIALRAITFEIFPQVTERIMYGGIMFTLDDDFGGLFPSKKHVSFEFSQGFGLDDPEGLLEGKGKLRRHLKFKTMADVTAKTPSYFVEQLK
ncbi:MAG: DUF1801 domain-containing protein [SAR324 cluster bacterium]|nr:DUF1801 domain-containing protein [SAR324 cluster bacterium]